MAIIPYSPRVRSLPQVQLAEAAEQASRHPALQATFRPWLIGGQGAAGAGGGGGEGAGETPGVKNFEGVRPWFELPGKAEVAKERIPLRAVAPDKALHLNHT